MANTKEPPVSEERIDVIIASARYWAKEIGPYGQKMRRIGNTYAILSTILSTITSLAVWTTLSASNTWYLVLIVSIVSLSAAVVSSIPQIIKYGECAEVSASLSSRYGNVLGDLLDVRSTYHNGKTNNYAAAKKAIEEFEAIKKEKDNLKPYPTKLQKFKDDQITQKQ